MGPAGGFFDLAWTIAILLVSAFALWRGGAIERLVAVANLVAWIATMVVQDRLAWIDPLNWVNTQWGVFAVDALFASLLLYLAMTRPQTWLLFAAAFQIIGMAIHLAMLVDDGFRARVYLEGLIIWSYLVLAALGAGAWVHWSEVRRGRITPDSLRQTVSPHR